MQDKDFNELVAKMEQIAEIVNKFSNPDLQRDVYNRLLSSINIAPVEAKKNVSVTSVSRTEAKQKQSKKKNSKYIPKMMKDLDLSPKGQTSFDAFIAEKKPQTNEDKYIVVVYYFEIILAESPVTIDHVFSVFRLKKWKEPKDLIGGITVAGSRKGILDTADYNNLKTTPTGRNFVEHELPQKND
jgi:hypothetical protein